MEHVNEDGQNASESAGDVLLEYVCRRGKNNRIFKDEWREPFIDIVNVVERAKPGCGYYLRALADPGNGPLFGYILDLLLAGVHSVCNGLAIAAETPASAFEDALSSDDELDEFRKAASHCFELQAALSDAHESEPNYGFIKLLVRSLYEYAERSGDGSTLLEVCVLQALKRTGDREFALRLSSIFIDMVEDWVIDAVSGFRDNSDTLSVIRYRLETDEVFREEGENASD